MCKIVHHCHQTQNKNEHNFVNSTTTTGSSTFFGIAIMIIIIIFCCKILLLLLSSVQPIANYFCFAGLSVISIATFLIRWIGRNQKLHDASDALQHINKKNDIKHRQACLKDLDAIFDGGLQENWNRHCYDNNTIMPGQNKVILLTGVTGYVGRAVLHRLFHCIQQNKQNNDTTKIILLVRAGKSSRKQHQQQQSQEQVIADRVAKLKQDPNFVDSQHVWDQHISIVATTDITAVNCGIDQVNLIKLQQANITHIVHCAADVNFNRPLHLAAANNITPALQLQTFAKSWPSFQRMIHVSTAFVNPQCGTKQNPNKEALYDLKGYDPLELYQSMMSKDQSLALEAKEAFQFQNNYVFTKCVAEHILARDTSMDVWICRPAIVGPAWMSPHQGWNGDKPSTFTGVLTLWSCRVLRCGHVPDYTASIIPVDVVACGIVNAIIARHTCSQKEQQETNNVLQETKKKKNKFSISNLIWSHDSPKEFMTWKYNGLFLLKYICLKGYLTFTEVALSHALMETIRKFPTLVHTFHSIFNVFPLQLMVWYCKYTAMFTKQDHNSKTKKTDPSKLLALAETLTLYTPYMGRDFYFEGSVHVPSSMDMDEYSFYSLQAVDQFLIDLKLAKGDIAKDENNVNVLQVVPKSRISDLWWAMTQPFGSLITRMIGFIASKIIRALYYGNDVILDLETFASAAKYIHHANTTKNMNHYHYYLFLVPTQRSLMDIILITYVAFAYSGLGIKITSIAAVGRRDFENFSFSYLLRWAGGFWIDCDSKVDEFDSNMKLSHRKKQYKSMVVFVEDSQNQERRFPSPEIDFLKALQASSSSIKNNNNEDHVYDLIPIFINHEDSINTMKSKLSPSSSSSLSTSMLENDSFSSQTLVSLLWTSFIMSAEKKKTYNNNKVGNVRISFGAPVTLSKSSNVTQLSHHLLQEKHRALSKSATNDEIMCG